MSYNRHPFLSVGPRQDTCKEVSSRWLRLRFGVQILILSAGFASAIRAPAQCFSTPSGLAGWWPGDGTANNLLGTNNGTLSGSATATNAGLIGQAFTFNGSTAFVSIPDSPALKPTNLTLEAWVRFSSLDSTGSGPAQGNQYIVFKQNTRASDFEGYDLSKTRSGALDYFAFRVSSAAGAALEILSTSTVTTGVWYHVAAVRGSNFVQLYVNGALQRQTNVAFAQDYGATPLYFGSSGQPSWDRKLAGTLDEVALYSRALASNEIAAIYAAGAAGKCKAVNIATSPQSQTAPAGTSPQFTVAATGFGTLNYQWRFNGTNLTGATASNLTLTNVQPANGGNYTVVVTNTLNSATSAVAVLTVALPPGISAGPQSTTNNQGSDATFSVNTTGTPPFSYQWRFNGGNISGATGSAYTRTNVQPADAGNYSVVVTNVAGVVTSAVATLTVNVPPSISAGPQSATNNQGSDATFSVTATGTAPLSYQWRFNGGNIGGATGSSYTRTSVQPADVGNYSVVVANVAGAITSAVATLTVNVPPGISVGPQSATNIQGSDATFSVIATGTAPLSYQWRFNGGSISGATGSSYTRTNVQPVDAGNYTVVVTNVAGAITSSVASLTVNVSPGISAGPQSATNIQGSDATFIVAATGTAPLSYQWRFNGGNIGGATGSSYTRTSVQPADAGSYTVVVTNVAGAITSAVASLTVNVPPGITAGPLSLTNIQGTDATFSVNATGTAPLSYQWRFNGGDIDGATASAYTRSNVQPVDAGNYSVVVTNVAGAITSSVASLTVNVPPGISAGPQSATNIQGSDATFSVTATGTAPLSYQWRFNGGNISGATDNSFARTNVQPTDAGNYSVVVTNVAGAITSAVASLTVNVPPGISAGPQSATNIQGSDATFSVTATGTAPLSYQWLFNGGNIGGATASTYTRTNVQPADAGNYSVLVTNVAGAITSSVASLTVNVPPSISTGPQSSTNIQNSDVTFSVSATGTAPLSYQWRFNGLNINGATGVNYTRTNVQPADAGNYTVVVTNVAGAITSAVASLTVNVPPGISADPQSTTNIQGSDATFSVTATGTVPLSYQWRFNGGNIGGATSGSYTRTNVQPADAGNYSVVVTNVAGAITSAVASLTVNVPPGISAGPQSTTNIQGSDATFSVSATGTAPLNYQWRFNGGNINGATANSYTRTNAQPADAGNYSVVVTNVAGAITSSIASLTVNVPPGISAGPQSRTNNQGTDATFNVSATGTAPLSYQWRFNAADISGATGSSYTRTNVQPADAGNYTVVVTNVAGAITSGVASLTVNGPPGINVDPQSTTNNQGSDATFIVIASGTAPLSYQWRFNGGNIGGATGGSYTRTNVQPSDAGNYNVVVTNVAGSITSAVASLSVNIPPGISTGPQSTTNNQGTDATFGVIATGTAPLGYQWRFNGGNIGGATGSSYTRTNVQPAHAGNYSVVITNMAGAITSSVASLSVNVPPGISLGPQSVSVNQGSNALFSVIATGTAPLNYQWRFTGTNINGATSTSYARTNVQPADTGGYTVIVTNMAGAITSSVASLTLNVPAGIAVGPQSVTTNQGSDVIFNVIATGTAPLSYQWRFNGANISNATSSTYTRINVQGADIGNYTVVVTNMAGAITSSVANLMVQGIALGKVYRVRKDGTGDFPAIQSCVNVLQPGDVCLVGAGFYPERIIFPPGVTGVPASNIVIKAEVPESVTMFGFDTLGADRIRIEGFNITAASNQVYVTGLAVRSSYVEVVSNRFSLLQGAAIAGSGNGSDNVSVVGNRIYKPGFGIVIAGHYWNVDLNEIQGVAKYPANGDADYVRLFGSYHVIRSNYFHDAKSSELDGAHTDAIQAFDNNGLSAQHIRIENNRFIGYFDEGMIFEGLVYSNSFDLVVCNNIFHDVSAWGVLMKNMKDVKVFNNVFSDMSIYGVGFTEGSTGEIWNNIFYEGQSTDYFDDPTSTATSGSNVLFRSSGSINQASYPNDFVNVNPLFVDAPNHNFYLKSNSPAINRAVVTTNFNADILGVIRPQGSNWDIGPYELPVLRDTDAPVISAVAVAPTLNQALFTWATDEEANSAVDFGTTTNLGSSVANSFDSLRKSQSVTVSNLLPNTVYYFRVRSTDVAGNTRFATIASFSTLASENNPPTVALLSPLDSSVMSGNVIFDAAATDGNSGVVLVKFLVDNLVVGSSSAAPYSFSWDSRGVLNGAHLLCAQAVDAQGNIGTSSMVTVSVQNAGRVINGLVGYWPLDDRKGNFIPDLSGYANDAAPVLSPALVVGKFRNAVQLLGQSDYLRIPTSPSLQITGNAISLAAWVKLEPLGETQTIIGKVTHEGQDGYPYCDYMLQVVDNGGTLRPQFGVTTADGNLQYLTANYSFTYSQWHHLACVYDGVDLRIYVDGVERDYRPASGNLKANGHPLIIGGNNVSTGRAKGLIDEVRVYNRALAFDEILFLSGAQKPAPPSKPRVVPNPPPS